METINPYILITAVILDLLIGLTQMNIQIPDVPAGELSLEVTVGGVDAATSYVGVPSWSVGVLQINFTVPLTAAPGPQLVVVSVGGVASAGATLTVTQ